MTTRIDEGCMACRWVVFDSPAEVPFKYGNVTWIRNGGCQCSCADMAACAAEGRAPAWGMGLVAQHLPRKGREGSCLASGMLNSHTWQHLLPHTQMCRLCGVLGLCSKIETCTHASPVSEK